MLPLLLENISTDICLSRNNTIDKNAILNIFMARFCSVFASKQIITNSIEHLEPLPLSYYALNLIPSGKSKNIGLNAVEKLFAWFKPYCDDRNNTYRLKEQNRIDSQYKDKRSRDKAYCEIFSYESKINKANSQYIYETAKWISENNFGALFFYDTEFANKFIGKNEYDDVLDMCLNLYDGEVDYTSVLSNKRKTLDKKISTSLYFASAYEKILEADANKKFKDFGDTGFFRRATVYFLDYNADVKKEEVPVEEIQLALSRLNQYSLLLKEIYTNIPMNFEYTFSQEANIYLKKYKRSIAEVIKNNFSYNDVLLPVDNSHKITLEGSFWKIIKNAFLMHILNSPSEREVSVNDLKQSVNFYNIFDNYLPSFLSKKSINERTLIKSLICKNLDKEFNIDNFLSLIRNEIYSEISYKEWNEQKKDLLSFIEEDMIMEDILCYKNKNIVKFYKKNNKNDDDLLEL